MSLNHEREGTERRERVHVRQLGVVDTMRWSWEALKAHPELVALTLAVSLFGGLASLGITPAESPTGTPSFAPWVLPFYAVYFLVFGVVWGVVYLSAEDAVTERPRSLAEKLTLSVRKLPALVVGGIVAVVVSAIGLVFLVLPGIYLFHRFFLSFPAIVIDRKGPFGGLSAGWSAGGGNVLQLFLVDSLYFLSMFVGGVAVGLFGPYSLLGTLVNSVVSSGLVPLFGLAFGHLYLAEARNQ